MFSWQNQSRYNFTGNWNFKGEIGDDGVKLFWVYIYIPPIPSRFAALLKWKSCKEKEHQKETKVSIWNGLNISTVTSLKKFKYSSGCFITLQLDLKTERGAEIKEKSYLLVSSSMETGFDCSSSFKIVFVYRLWF